MRNIHALIEKEFGKGNFVIVRRWEKLEKKISDFQNHRRFTHQCLSQNITPTNIKLKSGKGTPWELKLLRNLRNN